MTAALTGLWFAGRNSPLLGANGDGHQTPVTALGPTNVASAPTPAVAADLAKARPTPTATPQPLPPTYQDHYWLARPISADDNDWVARFYPYGSRGDGTYPPHHGVEFVNSQGTMALAVADGQIVVAGADDRQVWGARTGYYGLVAIIELDQQLQGQSVYVVYGHLQQLLATVGQRVRAGDPVGEVGMTGVAEGPHLHFEVRVGDNTYGNTCNPELWLAPHAGRGTLAAQVLTSDGQPIAEAQVRIYSSANLNVPVRELATYPRSELNSDPAWGENLATGDLPAGDYVLAAYHKGLAYQQTVRVLPGATTLVTIRTGG